MLNWKEIDGKDSTAFMQEKQIIRTFDKTGDWGNFEDSFLAEVEH